jgi:hypothetical protein
MSSSTLEAPPLDPERCDQLAYQGTGYGLCNTRLDHTGQCPRANFHAEVSHG